MTDQLRALNHTELLASTRKLAETERRISIEILHHLAEIDRRRAYAKLGYPSLWEYALKELRYSENAAYRRISAMRALQLHPELGDRIAKGDLSVTTVSQVQSFFKTVRDQAQQTFSKEQREAVFKNCENKSSRDVTRELVTLSPLAIRVQKERAITENRTQISFVADAELLNKIHRVRDLSAPRLQNPASYPELMNLMSEVTLEKIDPLRKPEKKTAGRQTAENKSRGALLAPKPTEGVRQSRSIAPSVRARIWKEFEGKCAFISEESGRRCNSRFGLEIEHCQPFGIGGDSKDPENLRLLCRRHNQWQAIKIYGLSKMDPYLNPQSGEITF